MTLYLDEVHYYGLSMPFFLQILPLKILDLFSNNLCDAAHTINDTVKTSLSIEVITKSRWEKKIPSIQEKRTFWVEEYG